MNTFQIVLIALSIVGCALSVPTQAPTTEKPSSYVPVPHATFLNANSYVDNVPYGVPYNPNPPQNIQSYNNDLFNALMPSARVRSIISVFFSILLLLPLLFKWNQHSVSLLFIFFQSPLDVIIWLFTRVGAVVLGSTAIFILGGLFNLFVCSMTSFCTYDFKGLSNLDQESVRALITPEKISTAAALVQDAIGKYNRLQREIRNWTSSSFWRQL